MATVRPRRRREAGRDLPVVHWLRMGAAVAGIGAALVAGQGVALADPDAGTDSEPSSAASSPDSTESDTAAGSQESETDDDVDDTEGEEVDSVGDHDVDTVDEEDVDTKEEDVDAGSVDSEIDVTHSVDTDNDEDDRTALSTAAPSSTAKSARVSTAEEPVTLSSPSVESSTAATSLTVSPVPIHAPQATVAVTSVSPKPVTEWRPVRGLVLGVLGLFGFDANPAPGSGPNSPFLEAIWAMYRRIESFVDNSRPTAGGASLISSEIVGGLVEVKGTVDFDDYDDDPLTYSVTNGVHGTVTVGPDGTFTYTPDDPSYTGSDSFTVTATDKGWHSHGLLSFLRPGGGHTVTATVAITLAATPNHAPVISNHSGPSAPDEDGKVTGSFIVTDVDGDPIQIGVDAAPDTVEYTLVQDPTDPTVHTVTYTYTPTVGARLAASYAGANGTESFGFTAYDSEVVTNELTVTATVVPFQPHTEIATVETGGEPIAVAVSPDGATAYIGAAEGTSVWVIDTATRTVTGTITVGSGPSGLAMTPDGTTLYVTNSYDDTISVVDTATNTVIATIELDATPSNPAAAPDGSAVYVVHSGGVYVVDTTTHTVVKNIAVAGMGSSSRAVEFAPGGATAYVTTGPGVAVIDTATRTVTRIIETEHSPGDIAVSADGHTVYVTDAVGGYVLAVDTATDETVATISVPFASYLDMSADGTLLYVTQVFGAATAVIDTATNTVLTTIPVGGRPHGVAFSPTGDLAYVGNVNSGTVSVIWTGTADHVAPPSVSVVVGEPDATTGAVILTVTTADDDGDHVTVTVSGLDRGTVVHNGDGTLTYTPFFSARLAAASSDAVEQITVTGSDVHGYSTSATAVVDIAGFTPNTIADLASVGDTNALVVAADGKTAYLARLRNNDVAVFDTATHTVIATIPVGDTPRGLAISPDGATLWVANSGLGTGVGSISVIDLATNTVVHTIPPSSSGSPYAVAFSTNGTRVYVTDRGNNVIRVFDAATRATVATLATGQAHRGIAVLPDGSALYVTGDVGKVLVIDTETNTVAGTINVDGLPGGAVVSPDGSKVYVATNFSAFGVSVAVIDTATNTVISTIPTPTYGGQGADNLVLSPDGRTLYVTHRIGNSVSVIDIATSTVSTAIGYTSAFAVATSPDGTAVYVASPDHPLLGAIATGWVPPEAV